MIEYGTEQIIEMRQSLIPSIWREQFTIDGDVHRQYAVIRDTDGLVMFIGFKSDVDNWLRPALVAVCLN